MVKDGCQIFDLSYASQIISPVKLPLLGKYNISNFLAAVAVTQQFINLSNSISQIMLDFKLPLGRLQKIENSRGVDIFIDFAHIPNGLDNLLETFKKRKKLIVVIGAEGERDPAKRIHMGKIASEKADRVVITAVDPRSENVFDINRQILKGVNPNHFYKIHNIPDRGMAVYFAINYLAETGSTVLICGKGHEEGMNIDGVEHEWSDKKAVNEALVGRVHKIGKSI